MSDVYLDSSAVGYHRRAQRLAVIAAAVFGVFVVRLLQLQIIEGDDLRASSERNFVRSHEVPADRGDIYDRNGHALAVNRAAFDLYVTPAEVTDVEALIGGLQTALDLDALDVDRLRERIEEPRGMWRFRPLRVQRDIDRERVARAEALRARVDGISIRVHYQRVYPDAEDGAHLVGYLGKPNAQELEDPSHRYSAGSMIGRFGIERRFEDVLAGRDGRERFVVDARGARRDDQRALNTLDREARVEPVPGNDVVLTIDAEVQRILVRALAHNESGAAVVVDPRDGSILGMISKPAFDPNEWSGRLTPDAKRAIDENPYNPMLDKTVQSYFPGSVYKIVTALAALEENIIDADTEVDSPGQYEFGNRVFHCYKSAGHGMVDLSSAMAASADVYYYKLGERLGIDTLADYGKLFGFGQRTALGINGESRGIVPTREWHERQTDGGFQYGLALSTAVGQGDVRATPLQVGMAYAALANGGTVFQPRILDRIQTKDGTVVTEYPPQAQGRLEASPAHLQAIVRGLERAVADPDRGTGHNAYVPGWRIAGKTGTAQVRQIDRGRMRDTVKRFQDRDHAWFAAFAPVESPRLVVVVFLEHGGTGGKEAAPVARQIIQAYHERVEPIFQTQASVGVGKPARSYRR